MAQLWGGRFTGTINEQAWAFNASIGFDIRLLPYDIEGSIAHATMLGKQGIIPQEDADAIVEGLKGIESELQPACTMLQDGVSIVDGIRVLGRTANEESIGMSAPILRAMSEEEDVHSFVERLLIERIGDAGKKLHTGRSRNDQVATDMRLYTRAQLDAMTEAVSDMLSVLHALMKEHLHTWMPGFTHLQKAQPVTLAHHLGAYYEMFLRDKERLASIRERMNVCPLGSGALAGTTYPLDRELTAELLGFARPSANSMDGVSDRDYLIESVSALSILMMHLSRFSEELILWNSDEYKFVTISDGFSTGSSIMPQKKNPDIAELTRGKTGRVYGDLASLLTLMKSIPLAYNKDMQEDKEAAFDAFDTVLQCLTLFSAMLKEVTFHKERMEESAKHGFTNATDAADYLVKKGLPFRDAHEVIGRLVLHCIDKECAIDDVPLTQLKEFSDLFEEDVYETVSLKTCVENRITFGGPSPKAMQQVIEMHEA